MKTRYIYIRGYIFLLLVYIKKIPKMIDTSSEAHTIKIGDVLDSNLVNISACGYEGSAEGGGNSAQACWRSGFHR